MTILQGTKAYGGHIRPMRVPACEDQPRVEHPNFYWLHEDYVRAKGPEAGFAWTILRPQLIVGPNHGVAMNLPPVIGVYAAIRRAEGLPFSYPGGPDWVWEAADVRVVANAAVWAATLPAPTFISTVKIKQAGYTETCNTEQSFRHWLGDLVRRRVLPGRGQPSPPP